MALAPSVHPIQDVSLQERINNVLEDDVHETKYLLRHCHETHPSFVKAFTSGVLQTLGNPRTQGWYQVSENGCLFTCQGCTNQLKIELDTKNNIFILSGNVHEAHEEGQNDQESHTDNEGLDDQGDQADVDKGV